MATQYTTIRTQYQGDVLVPLSSRVCDACGGHEKVIETVITVYEYSAVAHGLVPRRDMPQHLCRFCRR